MKIFNFLKKPIKKIDDFREWVENEIALGLEKLQGNQTVDNGERVLVGIIITAVEAKTGMSVPEETKKQIKDGVVIGLDKANIALVKQLEKP